MTVTIYRDCLRRQHYLAALSERDGLFSACHAQNIYIILKWICVMNCLSKTAVHNTLEDSNQSQTRLNNVSIIGYKTLVCPAIRDPGTVILQHFPFTSVFDVYLFMRYELYVICFVVPSHAKLHMYITASNQYSYVTC